ncbi:MAG: formylglycine-generating enzyme family protein [Gemmatimonadetes bacterium]|nr:formylglycine-generating enzyme family protein [Gemmatimonadota bacterium]
MFRSALTHWRRAGGRPPALLLAALLVSCVPAGTRDLAVEAPGVAPSGMVWIAGGTFAMGDDGPFALPHEQPVHEVSVDGFFMDVAPVTNARFEEFVRATGYVTIAERAPDVAALLQQLPPGTPPPAPELLVPGSVVFTPTSTVVDLRDVSQWWRWTPGANWRHPLGPDSDLTGRAAFPVVHIAWDDAVAFATWAGGRLPTEAEWEYAARGGLSRAAHAWGDAAHDTTSPQAHIYRGTFPTHPAEPVAVGSYAANGYGLHDMAGNVWQWTSDWYRPDTYTRRASSRPVVNPAGPATPLDPRDGLEATRVIRGGSFLCNDAYCRGYRVSARGTGAPDTGASHIGFRIVMTPDHWRARAARAGSPAGTPLPVGRGP